MKTVHFFSAFLLAAFSISAQITGAEQDCIGAIPICGQIITQTHAYQGTGMTEDIPNGISCLENEENNSVWYTFDIAQSGMLEFTIDPDNGPGDSVDYDFALFNITGATCEDIQNSGLEVRCNYAFTANQTGLRTGYINFNSNSVGLPFCAPLQVTAGEKFALLIDNFSSITNGFTLDFSSSTATFGYKPEFGQVRTTSCDGNDVLLVQFNQPVPCNLINSDGSNFGIAGASAITVDGIYKSDCATESSTNFLILDYSGTFIEDSSYVLQYHSDSVPYGLCAIIGDTFPFVPRDTSFMVTAGFTYSIYSVGRHQVRFYESSQGEILTYSWSTGDGFNYSSQSVGIHTYATGGTYNVCLAVTGFCESDTVCQQVFIDTATLVHELNQNIQVELFPNPTTGILTVETDIPSNAPVTVSVFDVFGKQVYREEKQSIFSQFDLNLETLSPGAYFLRLSNHEFYLTRRFTILR